MKSHTEYLTFNFPPGWTFVNITPQVEEAVRKSGVREGLLLVQRDAHHRQRVHQRRRAGPARRLQEVAGRARPVRPVAGSAITTTAPARTTPTPTTSGRSWAARSSSPITKGKLDFGPWEQIFYGEFDGRRPKRVLVKIIGE